MSNEEQVFIRSALQNVEKAYKIQRVKQIVLTVLAFGAAFWFGRQGPSHELNVECVVIIGVGLIAALCTAKITSLINKNTRAVLRAVGELQKR